MAEQQKKAEVCLSDAQTQASKILVEAQSKYDEFLNQAKVEAEELKTAAKEEGYRLGYDEGYATALEQVKKEMERNGVEVIAGIIKTEGAQGEMKSIYVYDPDGNLVEIASYL